MYAINNDLRFNGVFKSSYSRQNEKIKDASNLTYEEQTVLNEVKNIIAGLGDSRVKTHVTEPLKGDNNMTISSTGFSYSAVDSTGDFTLGYDVLQKMVEDKEFKNKMMIDIQEMVQLEKENRTNWISSLESSNYSAKSNYNVLLSTNNINQLMNAFMDNSKTQSLNLLINKYEDNFNFL